MRNVNYAELILGIILGVMTGCKGSEDSYWSYEPRWSKQPVRVDLTAYGSDCPNIEFSADGDCVCTRWLGSGLYGAGPPLRVVFDFNGNLRNDALDPQGQFTSKYVAAFPRSIPHSSYALPSPLIDTVKGYMPFPAFLRDAGAWGFSRDLKYGLRLVDSSRENGGEELGTIWSAELWRMTPREERLWAVDLPPQFHALHIAEFFERDDKDYVLLAFDGSRAYILSQEDGSLETTLQYGPKSAADAEANAETFDPDSCRPAGAEFTASTVSFDRSRNRLACGESTGKRVRVLSLDRQGELVFEANSYDSPYRPRGGVWSVQRVEFAAAGKYLIVEYSFAGRSTPWVFKPTEIFETENWRRAWHEDSKGIDSVSLSPDGTKLALVRSTGGLTPPKRVLEIGTFVPEPQR